jgi:ParB family chromosome partitioning protein
VSKKPEVSHGAAGARPRATSLLDDLADETTELLARLDAPAPEDAPLPFLPISDIAPDPAQPRRHIKQDAIEALAADIARVGILQPVVVRPAKDWNGYVLVFGERRYRAALLAGLTHVPALIRRDLSEAEVLELQWQENAQREDVDDIDKAFHLKRLKEVRSLSWSQMAETVHLSRRHLLRMQQLAEMPDVVIAMVRDRRLTPSHAYQLARLSDSERQTHLAQEAVSSGWSVQRLAEAIRSTDNPEANAKNVSVSKDHPWTTLLDSLREQMNAKQAVTPEEKRVLRQIATLATRLCDSDVPGGDMGTNTQKGRR